MNCDLASTNGALELGSVLILKEPRGIVVVEFGAGVVVGVIMPLRAIIPVLAEPEFAGEPVGEIVD